MGLGQGILEQVTFKQGNLWKQGGGTGQRTLGEGVGVTGAGYPGSWGNQGYDKGDWGKWHWEQGHLVMGQLHRGL
jgi:hypothetical protein